MEQLFFGEEKDEGSIHDGRALATNRGCDLGHEASIGTFITTDCSTSCDMSHIVAPPASRMLDDTTWWYDPYDENWAEADALTFTEDRDREHPQGDFHGKR